MRADRRQGWGTYGAARSAGLLVFVVACSGSVEPILSPSEGPDLTGPGAGGGSVGGGAHGGAGVGGGGGTGSVTQSLGRTGPRRLSNVEYDNTVHDLLGTTKTLGQTFVSEEASGFDNVANGLGMSPSQFESYFNAAETLSSELFADAARSASVLPCNPSNDDKGACLDQLLASFATRVFRRPLQTDEKAALRNIYEAARTLELTPPAARQQVLTAMLSSPQFLYRVELDSNDQPSSRPLDGYELASRLSYFLWSSTPDAALLASAASGELITTAGLKTQLTRMLADARADSLIDNFAAQWLGLRELDQHKVLAERYPDFDDALRSSMIQEAKLFFAEFLRTPRPLKDFLGSSLHFVDTRLATLYGLPQRPGTKLERVETPVGERRGFLGLASFLTLSSFAQRTSPTLRAKWVLEELLCSHVPPPPANVVADLESSDDAANAAASIENVRKRLELHRSAPACAGCHAGLDPIGLGLEGFDAIGRARTKYENGDPIDTHGELPGGEQFDGPAELATVLIDDPRFPECVAQKLLTYALGRSVLDEPELLEQTLTVQGEQTLGALLENIVLADSFRKQLPSAP